MPDAAPNAADLFDIIRTTPVNATAGARPGAESAPGMNRLRRGIGRVNRPLV
jgi:hypothetical protein